MTTPASGARTRVAYIPEVTPGTTPATPTFLNMRVTGAGIRTNKSTKAIAEINPDLNVRDEPQVSQSASAAYNFALNYGSLDDIIANVLGSSWATNAIGNSNGMPTLTFEETLDLNGALSFSRLTYGLVNDLSLNVQAGAEISGSFNVVGQKETLATAIISGATYTAANAKAVMAAGLGVGALSIGSLTAPKVKGIKFDIKRNLRQRFVVDSLYVDSFGQALVDVTGTLDLYFASNAHYQAVLDHGGGALAFTLGTVTGEKYTVSMPNIVFLDGARQVGGTTSDVMVSIPFRALFNSGTSNSISITRAVA